MPAATKAVWGFFQTFRKSTGLQADAGSTPTVTLYKNGTATADSVTVSKVATGLYKWTATIAADAWFDKDILEAVAAITDADAVAETVPVDRREIHWQTVDEMYTRLGAPAGASVSADVAAVKVVDDAIKAKTDNLPASPAAAGSQMDLVSAPNATALAAIGAKVEAMVLDEGDATALLAAIAAKVEEFLVNEGDATATIAAIAAACNAAIAAGAVGTNVSGIKATTDKLDSMVEAV